ncbi:hypothetical protein ACFWVM_33680 [Nocardia fluminea]|uniref:hypothetical protein n=1 Tax=Nocardia fluminea TaxID=134984 RepID=UPI003652D68C
MSMFRRKPAEADPLLHAPLPARVEAAHSRLAQQGDPALIEALSERELRDERAAAELVRDHRRSESIATVKSAQTISGEVRRAQEEMVRAEAADLVVARRAIAERLRSSSATFDIARLHREKRMAARGLTGVVIASMLWSAANVQNNLAPGGPSDPLFWFSYALEATISIVLVVIMVSGASVSRWGVTEGDERIRRFEVALLLGSIGLNVYPYVSRMDLVGAAVHSVAPVMVGVALLLHPVVQRRYGLAIDRAKVAADAEGDDITARLDALTATASRTTPSVTAAAPTAPADEDAVIEEYEAELRADDRAPAADATDEQSRATEAYDGTSRATDAAFADRAQPVESIARDESDRAPIARETVAREDVDRAPIAREGYDVSRATLEKISGAARDHHATRDAEEHSLTGTDRGEVAHEQQPLSDTDRAPIAAHIPAELGTDHGSIAAHSSDPIPRVAVDAEESRADDAAVEEPIAREQEPVDRARNTPIALVSVAREDTDRARTPRTDRAREASTTGALARATEPAPIARDTTSRATDHGPFDRALSRAEAGRYARAVSERGLSKQPVPTLTEIYLLSSQGHTANAVGTQVGLAHSTVGRALARVAQVVGPRPI